MCGERPGSKHIQPTQQHALGAEPLGGVTAYLRTALAADSGARHRVLFSPQIRFQPLLQEIHAGVARYRQARERSTGDVRLCPTSLREDRNQMAQLFVNVLSPRHRVRNLGAQEFSVP